MKRMRWKNLAWVLGVVLLAGSAIAANRMLHAESPGGGASHSAPPPKAAYKPVGLTVLGTVDTPRGITRVDAPAMPALSGLTVKKVHVVDGQSVIGNQSVLIEFDNSLFKDKVDQANAELAAARSEELLAKLQEDELPNLKARQEIAVKKANEDQNYAEDILKTAEIIFERSLENKIDLNGNKLNKEQKDRERRENFELKSLRNKVELAKLAVENEIKLRESLVSKEKSIKALLAAAKSKIERLEATVKEAKAFVAAFTIVAKVDGVVEQVAATEGMTFGPTTRTPVMWIVPTGTRIVRAEIDAEFAQKIADKKGKMVKVCDQHNFTYTYDGKVTRIGTSFLPKRGSSDTFNVNPTRILEVEIEILDPHPKDQPPLLVGQPVRVDFGANKE